MVAAGAALFQGRPAARATVNFSEHNSRGGCSTENGKQKAENFSEPAIAAGLKRGKEFFRLGGFRTVIGRPCAL
jgi:hypothetical protein